MYDYVSHCLHDAICDACCFHVGLPLLPGLILSQRIVVVDDIQTNRLIAGRVLRAFGAHVEFAEDGKGACEAVAQARLPFHLILMDCHMPVMDGVSYRCPCRVRCDAYSLPFPRAKQFEASRMIRSLADRARADVPIIAISASALQPDIERSLEAGMNAHLSKPIDAESLASCVMRWVGAVGGKRA